MACSLLTWAVIVGVAAAQSDSRPAISGNYPVTVVPRPAQGPTITTQAASSNVGPLTIPDSVQPAAGWQMSITKPAPYRKDARAGSLPAAGLAKPKAQENKPKSDNGKNAQGKSEMIVKPDAKLEYFPPPEQMFRLESEKELQGRIQKDPKHAHLEFPPMPPLPGTYRPALAANGIMVEPNYVDYRRLLFEDKNTERYGWNLGAVQPLVSASKFVGGMAALPYKVFSWPCLRFDSSAGLCLPGDPVPYFLYPPGFSVNGLAAEVGVWVTIPYIFLVY